MRRLHFIPSLLIQLLMLLLNLGLGIHNLHTHFRAWPSFAAAGFIAGITIVTAREYWRMRGLRNRIFQLQQEANQIMAAQLAGQEMLMAYPPGVLSLARDNFMKAAKAISAKDYNTEAPWIRFRAKKTATVKRERWFLITYGSANLLDDEGKNQVSSTCWQNNYSLPPLEAVAGAALLLYNKSELFEFWRDYRGTLAS